MSEVPQSGVLITLRLHSRFGVSYLSRLKVVVISVQESKAQQKCDGVHAGGCETRLFISALLSSGDLRFPETHSGESVA
ncbi:hypothetical protein KOW79_005720 [Hemibagrus wyckioides]|uniref:Uncharacterized protein n=1 Tax=Hemibagrus wyckioides TaxID=337641 RepID=A0A9D3NZ39_9TELE|nr:hypothetical protein KOW79_005720 [Hemibagrus wyckioides]